MRLSDEKARRLSRLVWRERAKFWLPLVFAGLVLFGLVAYFTELAVDRTDRTVDVQTRAGTVVAVKRGSPARGAAIVQVHLEDGRDVEAFSVLRLTPQAGAHVVVTEARHASGKLTYDIVRLVD